MRLPSLSPHPRRLLLLLNSKILRERERKGEREENDLLQKASFIKKVLILFHFLKSFDLFVENRNSDLNKLFLRISF